jgi:hypothetical protein
MPDNIDERPAWYAAEMRRQATRRGTGRRTGADRQQAEQDDAIAEEIRAARALGGPALGLRYEVAYVDGVPRLVQGNVTRPTES